MTCHDDTNGSNNMSGANDEFNEKMKGVLHDVGVTVLSVSGGAAIIGGMARRGILS